MIKNSCKSLKPFSSFSLVMSLLPVVVFLLCLSNPVHAASCRRHHRDSLLSLTFNISNPSSPLNWSSEIDCCVWEGISCDANGQVTRLWLPQRGLHGVITQSIQITTVTHINLSRNSLSGDLPAGFFTSLNQLQVIDLSNNCLSGELLSTDILPLSIQTVDLSSIQFHGEIASSFNEVSWNLTAFTVSNNSFTGHIPSSVCNNSPSIILFDFSSNKFEGDFPHGFGGCKKLEVLRGGHNFLSGQIPGDIYSILTLTEMSVPANKLVGSISDGISNMSKLKILELYDNDLGGAIPESIGKLSNLEILFLHDNNLSSTLPPSLTNCTKLRYINLRKNKFEGSLSLNFSNLSQLRTVDLGNNNFTGSLPRSLFLCKSLVAIRLSTNQLEGEIMTDIAVLQSLSFCWRCS